MGNELAQGHRQQPPGPLMTSGLLEDKKPSGFILESDKSNITKVTDAPGLKPKETMQAPELGTQNYELKIVNIVRLTDHQFLVELEDGSEYKGGLHNSLFNGYGEILWRSNVRRYSEFHQISRRMGKQSAPWVWCRRN